MTLLGEIHLLLIIKENWSLTKNIDLTLNATALILIKYIRVNVIHRVSNCYLAQTSSTLYWGTVTICNPSTEKNHPVCRKPEICISNRLEMAKKRKSLLVLGKAKMNNTLNENIFIDRLDHRNCYSQYHFFKEREREREREVLGIRYFMCLLY